MIMYTKPLRHGDVDFIPVQEIPQNATLQSSNIVMHGESGHEHTLFNGQILISEGRKFVKSTTNSYMLHEEHNKIPIPEGMFEIKQEVEFDPFTATLRRVRD